MKGLPYIRNTENENVRIGPYFCPIHFGLLLCCDYFVVVVQYRSAHRSGNGAKKSGYRNFWFYRPAKIINFFTLSPCDRKTKINDFGRPIKSKNFYILIFLHRFLTCGSAIKTKHDPIHTGPQAELIKIPKIAKNRKKCLFLNLLGAVACSDGQKINVACMEYLN